MVQKSFKNASISLDNAVRSVLIINPSTATETLPRQEKYWLEIEYVTNGNAKLIIKTLSRFVYIVRKR